MKCLKLGFKLGVALAAVGTTAAADVDIPPSVDAQRPALEQWHSMTGPAPLGQDGRVILTYGAGPASLICAPNTICQIELGRGEEIYDTPALADPVRWSVELREAIIGGETRHILLIKPSQDAETTVLGIFTNRRSYSIRLVSDPDQYTPHLAFRYPDDERRETERRIAQARADREAREAAEAARVAAEAAARAAEIEVSGVQVAQAHVPASELNFNYRIAGDAPFEPVRIYDNGVQTFIQLSEQFRGELPIFMGVSQGASEAVNYRVDGRLFIIDGVFDEGALINGGQRIRIRKTG